MSNLLRNLKEAKAVGRRSGYNVTTLFKVAMVRAKLVKIGNSRGIRISKPLLEVAGLADEVEIEAVPGVLTIRPSTHPRAGWAESAAAHSPAGLLDEMTSSRFEDEEWSW
jgi:antitoxin MazE